MLNVTEVFRDILPVCDNCGVTYDLRRFSPQILPCAHTYCLSCLSTTPQTKKKRCLSCKKKYSSFLLNKVFADTVERVQRRRGLLASCTRRCDECQDRFALAEFRRCATCESSMNKHVSVGVLDCVICLHCCIDQHNGHRLVPLNGKLSRSEASGTSVYSRIWHNDLPPSSCQLSIRSDSVRQSPRMQHVARFMTGDPVASSTCRRQPTVVSNCGGREDDEGERSASWTRAQPIKKFQDRKDKRLVLPQTSMLEGKIVREEISPLYQALTPPASAKSHGSPSSGSISGTKFGFSFHGRLKWNSDDSVHNKLKKSNDSNAVTEPVRYTLRLDQKERTDKGSFPSMTRSNPPYVNDVALSPSMFRPRCYENSTTQDQEALRRLVLADCCQTGYQPISSKIYDYISP